MHGTGYRTNFYLRRGLWERVKVCRINSFLLVFYPLVHKTSGRDTVLGYFLTSKFGNHSHGENTLMRVFLL